MIVKLKNAVPRKSTGAFDFYFLKNVACVSESWSVIVSQKALSEMQLVLKGHIWTPDGRGRGSSVCVLCTHVMESLRDTCTEKDSRWKGRWLAGPE